MPDAPRPRRTTPAPRRRKTDGWQRAGNLQGEEGNPFEKGFSPFPPHPPFPFPKRFSVKKTGALPVPRRKAPHPDGTAVFLRMRTAARRECRICTGRRGGFPGTAQDGSVSGRDGGRDRQSVPQGKRFRKVEGARGEAESPFDEKGCRLPPHRQYPGIQTPGGWGVVSRSRP